MAKNFLEQNNITLSGSKKAEYPVVSGASIPFNERANRSLTGESGVPQFISAYQSGKQPIQTPRGTIYATQEQAANLAAAPSRTLAQQSSRSPAEQQALLAQMRERGAAIGERLAGEQTNRYYAFRQSLAEKEAQKALTPSYGGYVGNIERTRAANALVEAEAMKQAQQGRSPLSQEPISALGYQFQRGSMGQYNPVRSMTTSSGLVPSGGPQPSTSFVTMQPTFGNQSATGSIASGMLPSFANVGMGNTQDNRQRRNFPQDFFTGEFGSQGQRMIARRTPFDQTIMPL